jgi:predicted protein tyrosine phosphatase
MFQFKIDNAHRAYELMQEGWPTKVVSLVGPDLKFELPLQGDHHIMHIFHDFEGEVDAQTLKDTTWDLGEHPLVLPTQDMLYEVLVHCWDLTDEDRLLVHCHAGRSRSAAMLIGIIYDHLPGWGEDAAKEAVRLVHEARPTMIPNRLMIKYLDEIINTVGGETDYILSRAVKEYWDNCTLPGIMLRTQLSGWKD